MNLIQNRKNATVVMLVLKFNALNLGSTVAECKSILFYKKFGPKVINTGLSKFKDSLPFQYHIINRLAEFTN